VQILQQVELTQRLCCCSLVCKSWAAAAAEATTTCEVTGRIPADAVLAWLAKHGSHLTQLHASSFGRHVDQPMFRYLPCSKLRDMYVYGCTLQLAPSRDQPGVLAHATGLQHLSLHAVDFLEGPEALTALSVLTSLQHLDLMDIWNQTFPDVLLEDLVHLTHLKIGRGVAVQSLHGLGALTNLQRLILGCMWQPGGQTAALQELQELQQLTWLALPGLICQLDPSTTPGLAQLTALQHLEIQGAEAGLHPALLSHLTRLQHLDLYNTGPLGGAAGTVALLACLPRLQLTHLNLAYTLPHPAPTAAAYSTISASTQLQHLALTCSQVPAAAWRHFLAPPKQLPLLTSLELHHSDTGGQVDLSQVVQCCCSLQHLDLSCLSLKLPSELQLAALLRLSSLTSLTIRHVDSDAAAAVLSQLTRLVELRIWPPSSLSDSSVLLLTALRQLTVLYCPSLTGSSTTCGWLCLHNKVSVEASHRLDVTACA